MTTRSYHLNPQQREAVIHKGGPLLVLAGAGSGKTRVITYRIAHLIEECGERPETILAVTFTNKAAGEMKARVASMLGLTSHQPWVATFHAACLAILRQAVDRLGWTRGFTVYDDADSLSLIRKCQKELEIDEKRMHPKAVEAQIDAAKNALIGPEAFAASAAHPFDRKAAAVYTLYQKRLKEYNAVDFGDLIRLTVELFMRHATVLEHYRMRLRHILIDEYQDTNHAQYVLIKLLAQDGKNLVVVGDEDQSIYRWRGADISNVLNFERDFKGARVIKLEQNYRSTRTIVEAATEVIANNTQRKGKILWTGTPPGDPLFKYLAAHDRDEAAWVVGQMIGIKKKERVSWSDVALFYRTNAQSRLFEDELRRLKIPYRVFGGVRFYDRMEIKDLMAHLKFLANESDGVSLKRAIGAPPRGIGKTTLDRLEEGAQKKGISLWNAMEQASTLANLNRGVVRKIGDFVAFVQRRRRHMRVQALPDFIQGVLEGSGILADLKRQQTLEAEERLENLGEFVNLAAESIKGETDGTLEAFLDRLSLAQDTDSYDPKEGVVSLMTVHLAKGLEFSYVFVAGLEEGLFPHARSLEDADELEEERRLMYVAMTRARRRLSLSSSLLRRHFGEERYNLPSRFLDEIPGRFFDESTPSPSPSSPDRETRIVWGE